MSIFLGHPNYGLAIVLFGIILMTGAGSLLSERIPLASPRHVLFWSLGLGSYLFLLPHWLPELTGRFETSGLLARIGVCLLAIVPSGLLMGFGFPTGMRIVNRMDDRPTPWFWAVNGSAGVLAAGLGVAISIQASINSTLITGAICYLLLGPVAMLLLRGAEQQSGSSTEVRLDAGKAP